VFHTARHASAVCCANRTWTSVSSARNRLPAFIARKLTPATDIAAGTPLQTGQHP
jgi:hypothetical protein